MISLRERAGALSERPFRLLWLGQTTSAIGGIPGGAVALRLRPKRPLVGAFAGWSLSALPALALLPPLPTAAIAVAYGVFQAGIAFGNNQFDTVLQREIPSHLLSRVDSFVWLVALGPSPVGQALARGPASEAFGTDAVLVTAAVLVVVSCTVGMSAPSVRAITRARRASARASRSADESPLPPRPAPPP